MTGQIDAPARHALVDCDWVELHLDDPGVVLVETGNSDLEYCAGRPPGAVWIDWAEFQDDLRLGFVDSDQLGELMSRKGIGNDDLIVLYSVNGNLLASLAYWYLAHHGHRRLCLLDGGRGKWEREGRPLSTDPVTRPRTVYRPSRAEHPVRATRDDVLAAIGSANILDVRTPEEFSGAIFAPGFAGEAFAPGNNPHEVAQRSGHVPGALNIPWDRFVARDGTFLPDEQLAGLVAGLDPAAGDITYCWVGARSAHTWFVLHELLGRPDVRNYDGSWAEYGSLVGVPVERSAGVDR